jgi:hypothetical protein
MICYELVSGGQVPFSHLFQGQDAEAVMLDESEREDLVIRSVIYDSQRPKRIESINCPEIFWNLIEACWSQLASDRPSATQVAARLKVLLKMQARFRRQSQIKQFSEAFQVDVPLNDLMQMVDARLGSCAVSTDCDSTKRDSACTDLHDVGRIDSAYTTSPRNSMISMNLAFSLDNVIESSHLKSKIKLGIDLPLSCENEGEACVCSPMTLATCSENTRDVWQAIVKDEFEVEVSWAFFKENMRSIFPSIVMTRDFQRKIIVHEQSCTVSIESLDKFLNSSASASPFSEFCLSENPTVSTVINNIKFKHILSTLAPTIELNTCHSHLHQVLSLPMTPALFPLFETLISMPNILLDSKDSKSVTPLHLAAKSHGSLATEVVIRLLSAGANPSVKTCNGWTPLHMAAWNGNISICKALIEVGGKDLLSIVDEDGLSPKMYAMKYNHHDVVHLFQQIH